MSGRSIEPHSEPSGLAGLAPVPREALAQSKRRYYSPARRRRAEATREALLDAAVELIAGGDFRPEASAIAARAKVHPATINRHFSAAHLLFRVVARERTGAVLEALGLVASTESSPEPSGLTGLRSAAGPAARPSNDEVVQRDLVWIALTGRRRDGWT